MDSGEVYQHHNLMEEPDLEVSLMTNQSGAWQNDSPTNVPCSEPHCTRHPHWTQYEETAYGVHVSIGLIMAVVCFLSVAGNGFVIYVYTRFRSLRSPTHLLIVNLSLSDLGMALSGFPIYIIASFHGKWPFPPEVCQFYGFAGGAFGLLSINTLAAISIDRYHVIVRSINQKNRLTYKWAWLMIALVWVYSVAWAAPPLFGWNRYTWEGFGTTCSYDYLTRTEQSKLFILAMFIGGFCVPLGIIIYCYSYILLCVYKQRQNLAQTKAIRKGRQQKRRQVEIDTAKTVLIVIGLFCLSWMPYAIVSMIGVYGDQTMITPLASAIPGLFAKASTVYNPVIYAICLPKFKKKIRSLALRAFCNIEGDLVVVENWSGSGNDQTSNHSVSSLYRKPAVRARSGARRSEYSSSSQGSVTSMGGGRGSNGAGRTGLVVRYNKHGASGRSSRSGGASSSHHSSNGGGGAGNGNGGSHGSHGAGRSKRGTDMKMSAMKAPRTHDTIPENMNVCQVDLSKAIGADLQVLQGLLKQKHLKLSLDNNAKLVIAQCESSKESTSL